MISVNKFWLFKTSILDPFIFVTTSGVTTKMASERVIELLTIAQADFYFDNTAMAVLNWTTKYGGEDVNATAQFGKNELDFELMWDMPNYSQSMIERLVGNEWAVLLETTGRDKLVIFARFESEDYNFDSDQKGRMTLKSGVSSSRPYVVQAYSVTSVTYSIDRDFICDKINTGNFINIE